MTSNRQVYCTQEELLLALRRAFAAGQESPYELMVQEVDRIVKNLLTEVKRRTMSERLRKYDRYVESKHRNLSVGDVVRNPIGDNCPNCTQKGALIETVFKGKDGGVYSGLCCLRCGWGSSLGELRKKR